MIVCPLVDEEDIYAHDHLKEGDLFYLMNDRDQYIATAYVSSHQYYRNIHVQLWHF
jgi:hypothetical protein